MALLTAGQAGPLGRRRAGDDLVIRQSDGRATFEFLTVDGELRVRWRRVGDHDVFKNP